MDDVVEMHGEQMSQMFKMLMSSERKTEIMENIMEHIMNASQHRQRDEVPQGDQLLSTDEWHSTSVNSL